MSAQVGRGGTVPRPESSPPLLAGLPATAGVAHLASPRRFGAIVPRVPPQSPRTWTCVSGVAEFALAAGVALTRTRRVAAPATAAVFVGVFPADVKMAAYWRHRSAPLKAAAVSRPPPRLPLVLWARSVARSGEGRW
jgi:uncharacterized membrane protein